jgi:hypothetical protein
VYVDVAAYVKHQDRMHAFRTKVSIEVETATWSAGGTLDWWVKERRKWFGRIRGKDERQRWIRAIDLRPKEGC